jgi:hypothetical protein
LDETPKVFEKIDSVFCDRPAPDSGAGTDTSNPAPVYSIFASGGTHLYEKSLHYDETGLDAVELCAPTVL